MKNKLCLLKILSGKLLKINYYFMYFVLFAFCFLTVNLLHVDWYLCQAAEYFHDGSYCWPCVGITSKELCNLQRTSGGLPSSKQKRVVPQYRAVVKHVGNTFNYFKSFYEKAPRKSHRTTYEFGM